jgi:Ran GTPase-activating protein (RanGAP) involved in mRNA processing and transport
MLENYNNVKYLNLASNQIDDSGIEALASVMHNLKALNLSNNQITAKGASFLAEALKEGAALNVLILNNNPLQIDGVLEILSALKNNFALHSLGLKSVSIGDAQVEQIVLILLENIGIARLDLGSNGIYTNGAKHIVTLLKGNTPLSSLDLEGNQLAEDALAEITKSIPLSNVIALNYALDKSANIRKALSANVNKLQDKLKVLEKEDAINLTIQDLYKLYHQILVRKESSAPELSYVNIKDDASYLKQIEAFFKTLKAQKQDGIKEHEEEHQVMELVGEDKFLNALETLDILGIVEIPFDFIY